MAKQLTDQTNEDAIGRARALTSVLEDLEAERECLKREIAERKVIEEALKQSERRTAKIIESSLDAVVSIDEMGIVTGWNRQAEHIFGWHRDEALDRELADLILPKNDQDSSLPSPVKSVSRFVLKHDSELLNRRLEITAVRRGGERVSVELAISKLTLADGFEFSIFLRDVGELKAAKELQDRLHSELEARVRQRTAALQQANLRLQHSNEELQQFAYIASHDLQTPLRGIAGFAQLLVRDYTSQLDERGSNFLERIAAAAKRMQTLIEDLLKYSRVESHACPHEQVDLNDVVAISTEYLSDDIERTGAQIHATELPVVSGDSKQLVQLFQNLIENAIKYAGEEVPRLTISSKTIGVDTEIAFADGGIGIEPDHRERIFEVFKRLHNIGEYSGNGIGLAVCRRIIHRHGGRIWVDANEPEGCCFRITLPLN